jgi:hypothetical protein
LPWAWFAALAVVTLLSLATYAGVQQALRTGANDPQVQLAEDAAARLATGEDPAAVLPAGHIDIARSLAPWAAVARIGSGVVTASGELEGDVPQPPAGVLAHAVREGGNRVTWMPRPRVRIALVVVPVAGRQGLLVLAGRSLREVETRVDRLGRMCLLAWAAATGVVLGAWSLAAWGRQPARAA